MYVFYCCDYGQIHCRLITSPVVRDALRVLADPFVTVFHVVLCIMDKSGHYRHVFYVRERETETDRQTEGDTERQR